MALGTIEKPELPGVIFQYGSTIINEEIQPTDGTYVEVCMDNELLDLFEFDDSYNLDDQINEWIRLNSPIC